MQSQYVSPGNITGCKLQIQDSGLAVRVGGMRKTGFAKTADLQPTTGTFIFSRTNSIVVNGGPPGILYELIVACSYYGLIAACIAEVGVSQQRFGCNFPRCSLKSTWHSWHQPYPQQEASIIGLRSPLVLSMGVFSASSQGR